PGRPGDTRPSTPRACRAHPRPTRSPERPRRFARARPRNGQRVPTCACLLCPLVRKARSRFTALLRPANRRLTGPGKSQRGIPTRRWQDMKRAVLTVLVVVAASLAVAGVVAAQNFKGTDGPDVIIGTPGDDGIVAK